MWHPHLTCGNGELPQVSLPCRISSKFVQDQQDHRQERPPDGPVVEVIPAPGRPSLALLAWALDPVYC